MVFYGGYYVIRDKVTQKVKGIGECRHGLYYLLPDQPHKALTKFSAQVHHNSCNTNQLTAFQSLKVSNGSIEHQSVNETNLWHHWLGHAPIKQLKLIGCIGQHSKLDTCLIYPMGKMTKSPYTLTTSHATYPFELLHIDTWGPYRIETKGKHRYFLTVVDDMTRTTWVSLLKHKSEAFQALETFVKMAHTQFGKKMKIIRSDNALEFQDHKSNKLFADLGIIHQTTCVDRAVQNGRVERKHRNVLEMARCLRFQASLPKSFWGECILTASYIINRLPTPTLQNKSPFQALYNKPPNPSLEPLGV